MRLAELLGEVRNDTVENVERKQARTDQEREESENEMSEEEQEDEEDDDIPYNPKVSLRSGRGWLFTTTWPLLGVQCCVKWLLSEETLGGLGSPFFF